MRTWSCRGTFTVAGRCPYPARGLQTRAASTWMSRCTYLCPRISGAHVVPVGRQKKASHPHQSGRCGCGSTIMMSGRSEEHTSELQSRGHLVCRLLLEKKKIDA